MGQVIVFAFTAAANPTLLAAATVMLLLPQPKRLMLGYLCGAVLTSVTIGLVIVFAFDGSGTASTTQKTLSPAADLALGALALTAALVVRSGAGERLAGRRERRHTKAAKGPPRWQRWLSEGSPRTTFVIGAMLTLPGASYLIGLHAINKLDYGVVATVLLVLGFNVVMLLLLEVPIVGYVVSPEGTPRAIERAKARISRDWARFAFFGLTAVGAALILKGVLGLL